MIFTVPWAQSLVITSIVCLVLIVVPFTNLFLKFRYFPRLHLSILVTVLMAILLLPALFVVRGYKLANHNLYIQRLGWSSKIELSNFVDAEIDPQAMEKSFVLWGNGGFLSITGKHHNHKLGNFEAYATDPHLAVVLTFPELKIVVTPEDPSHFVRELNRDRRV